MILIFHHHLCARILSSFWLIAGLLGLTLPLNAQLYTQDFSTIQAPLSNTSLTTAPYCSATPNNTQLTSIASNGAGAVFEVNSAGKLVMSRSADVAVFTRAIDFSPVPTTMIWKFDISVSGNSTAQTNGAKFLTGVGLGTVPFGEEADATNIRGRIGLNWTANDGEFSLRNSANAVSSANFSGEQTVFWVQNRSGSTATYLGPNGLSATVANQREDVWIGTSIVFDEMLPVTSTLTLNRIKFIQNAGSATVNLDNILIAPITPAPTANATQTICGIANPTLANLSATGTSLQWYASATGGSPLPLSTPVTNGSTWYVSQTLNGVESVRLAVTVSSIIVVSNNSIAADQTICTGTTPATLTGAVPDITGGTGSFTYGWEISSTSASSGFSAIAGATAQDLPFATTLTANRWYRRRVNADACVNLSNVVAVTVTPAISNNTITAPTTAACSASPAATIVASTPTGGNGVYSYQWESSTVGSSGPFSSIPSSNTQTLAPGILTQTTWFRRIVGSGGCASTSAVVQYNVNQPITSNDATTPQTICSATAPALLNGSLPAGGNGTSFTYTWQSSATLGGTYTSISGATAQNYQPPSLTATTFYRRQVTSGSCPATFSDTVQVTVNPVISNNSITPNATQNVCSANTPPAFTGLAATGGNGTPGYQWESSTTSATTGFSAIPGATSQNYAPGLLSQTTWFRRVVTAGICPASTTAAVQYTVTQPILNNDATGTQLVCTGTALATLSGSLPAGGNGTSFSYVWQSSNTINGTYANISGATSQSYTPPGTTGTFFYRRQVSSGFCPSTFSETIQVTVNPVITSNTISPNSTQNLCSTNFPPAFSGSAATGGNGSISYQWQSSTTSASAGFTDIPGATSQSYAPGLLSQTTWFRRVVTAGVCPASVTPAVQYAITLPIINNDATPVTSPICANTIPETIQGSVPAGGSGTYAYLWEFTTTFPGGTWAGANSTTSNTQQNFSRGSGLGVNIWYRRRVTSGSCPATFSDTIAVMVNSPISGNTISAGNTTSTVASTNVCSANVPPTSFGNVQTGGTGTYLFQWESSTTSASAGFSPITGETNQSYSPPLLTQTTWFRRILSSGACPASTSNILTYNVTLPILDNDASGAQTICTGSTPTSIIGTLPTGGNGTSYTYAWQSSATLGGTYTSITGATGQNYQPPALTATTFYRRQVTSGSCPSTFSDTVQVTVNPSISNNTISPNTTQNVCSALPATPFTGSAASGGNGSITYQWQSSTTSSSTGFADIPGATSQSYSPGLLSQTTWFRRVVTAGICPASTTAAVQYTVTFPITNNDATQITSPICAGNIPEIIQGSFPSGGSGFYSFFWEATTTFPTSGSWSPAGSTTSNTQQNFSRGTGLGVNIWYRRGVSSGFCPITYSDTIAVLVNSPISGNTISAGSTTTTVSSTNVCSENVPPTAFGNIQTGGTGPPYLYQWESSTTNSATGYSPISGANDQSYSPALLTQTTWFRRILSSGTCPASTSNILTYNVTLPILNNDASGGPQNICSGTAPTPLIGSLPTGGSGTFAYVWESATAINGAYNSISGATLQNYSPPALTSSRWYRRRVTSGFCPITYSDTIEIIVTPAIGSNSISGVPANLCVNATPAAPFNGSVPNGGIGSYAFQWESSTVSATGPFSEIPGATAQTYSSGPLSVDTWFRRRVVSGVCTSFSSTSKVTIAFPITGNDITDNQTICPGTIPDTLRGSIPGGGTGTFIYQWQSSTASAIGPFSSISGATGRNFVPAPVSVNTWFVRRVTSSSSCPFSFSDTIQVAVYPDITNNVVFGAQVVCGTNLPQPLTGSNPSGGDGSTYTFQWQRSETGPNAGFLDVPGETDTGFVSPVVTDTVWYRRIAFSGGCQNISNSLQITTSSNPTVSIGPAMAGIVQGGISDPLGGSFGGSATGAVWTATEGTFFNNGGLTPGITTFQASLNSSPMVTLTLTSTGGPCPSTFLTKTINVVPDPNGITGVVNQYGQLTGPANLPVGSLVCTLASGQGSRFAKNDRALIIQMKGASISLPSNPNDETYGYITGMGNSGNHEYLFIDSVDGDVVYFRRCLKKAYIISQAVQLVKIPVYNGNYNLKGSTTVSAIRLTRRGLGYPPNAVIDTGFTITPVLGGTGLQLQARTDADGQIFEVEIINPGSGYVRPPLLTLPAPSEAPFNFPGYRAKAEAVMGLTAKQWNGRLGGILLLEVNGNVTLNDSIDMKGMGFSGGMPGDRGDIAPVCGAAAEYALPASSYERSGQKGEGITVIPANAVRGRGRYGTGGGGGMEPEGGGGGGANWQDGGRGGASSYIAVPISACSTTVSSCDNDGNRGGLGGGTTPSTPIGTKNVLRLNSYSSTPANCRIFLGGGGGGGHAFNFARGLQTGGAGGNGGGIVILRGNILRSNGLKINAEGSQGENANQDGGGGGGGGGAVLLDFDSFADAVRARVNGGKGGNSTPLACDDPGDLSYPIRYRYSGAGGGGGGGVVWFAQPSDALGTLASQCNLGQTVPGFNGDIFNSLAQQGGSSRSQSDLLSIENLPSTGSVFTVGGTSPKPNFSNLVKAAEFLEATGTDASSVTLRLAVNSSPDAVLWYKDPVVFRRISTPGCTNSNASLTIQPNGGPSQFLVLGNIMDDQTYIKADSIPKLIFENLQIQTIGDGISTKIQATGGSEIVFKNVGVGADIIADNIGNNMINLDNTTHSGSITIGNNQTLKIIGTGNATMNGSATETYSITLGQGSKFYLGDNRSLNLNGVSWINNGADSVEISPSASIQLSGNFNNQEIGGTSTNSFRKLDVTSNGSVSITSGLSAGNWNQTGSATISTNNQILRILDRVTSGPGSFTSTGAGRVSLEADDTTPVDVTGIFDNLEINSSAGAKVISKVEINQNLLLRTGIINADSNIANLIVQNPDPFSVVSFGPDSWVRGILQRKVQAGGLYSFPVGNMSQLQNMNLNLTSVSGGLSRLNVRYSPRNPQSHPLESIIVPHLEGEISFRNILPDGYWRVTPDSGSADYGVWLYPRFYSNFTQYSVMKRPASSNEWRVYGTLENPENTYSFIQSDSSVRRSGLSGFSDFAVAGGEDPLPLRFLDFRVFNRDGSPFLNWKMADCEKGTRFRIWRGRDKTGMRPTDMFVDAGEESCLREFPFTDESAGKPLHTLYYRIEATAPGEVPALSDIRPFSPGSDLYERAYLAYLPESQRKFMLTGEGVEKGSISMFNIGGQLVSTSVPCNERLIDLSGLPAGMYIAEFIQNGEKIRQRISVQP